jgi:hypothetical protein
VVPRHDPDKRLEVSKWFHGALFGGNDNPLQACDLHKHGSCLVDVEGLELCIPCQHAGTSRYRIVLRHNGSESSTTTPETPWNI